MAPWQPEPIVPPAPPLPACPCLRTSLCPPCTANYCERPGWPQPLSAAEEPTRSQRTSSWAGQEFTLAQQEVEGQSTATRSASTYTSYMKWVPLLCQCVPVFVNKGWSHIAVESTTVPSQIHSWLWVWLHIPWAVANTIIRGLLKYHELKTGKS